MGEVGEVGGGGGGRERGRERGSEEGRGREGAREGGRERGKEGGRKILNMNNYNEKTGLQDFALHNYSFYWYAEICHSHIAGLFLTPAIPPPNIGKAVNIANVTDSQSCVKTSHSPSLMPRHSCLHSWERTSGVQNDDWSHYIIYHPGIQVIAKGS